MSKTPPKTGRRERRERERELAKGVREREKLARLLPGGESGRPIEVASASVVEVHAKSVPCPLCGAELRVEEHVARMVKGEMLRIVRARCFSCGVPRELFFRLPSMQ